MSNNGSAFWKAIQKLRSMKSYNLPGTFGPNYKPHNFSKDLKFFAISYFIGSSILIILSAALFYVILTLPFSINLFACIFGIVLLIITGGFGILLFIIGFKTLKYGKKKK